MNLLACLVDVSPCPAESVSTLSLGDALDPVSLGVDALQIASVFGWGFGTVLAFYFLGYAVGVAVGMVRKI